MYCSKNESKDLSNGRAIESSFVVAVRIVLNVKARYADRVVDTSRVVVRNMEENIYLDQFGLTPSGIICHSGEATLLLGKRTIVLPRAALESMPGEYVSLLRI